MYNLFRKLTRLLAVTVCLVTIAIVSQAQTFVVGDFTCEVRNTDEVKITPTNRNSIISVVIPSTVSYNGIYYKVTDIDFRRCPNLRSADVTSLYLTRIPWQAFWDCTTLTNVILYDGVTEIMSEAFSGCSALRKLTIPESVTKIGRSIISGTAIAKISVPGSVSELDPYAFQDDKLEYIEVAASHPFLTSKDGVLYYEGETWDGNQVRYLVQYPDRKGEKEFTLDCSTIGPGIGNPQFLERLNLNGFQCHYNYNDENSYATPNLKNKLDYYKEGCFYISGANLKSINIIQGEPLIGLRRAGLPKLASVEVDPSNDNYIIEDGLIYKNERHEAWNETVAAIQATTKDLWMIPPQCADNITSYTGCIGNNEAFQWCDNLKEIFDFSFSIGNADDSGFDPIDISHVNHSITYYVYPIWTHNIGYRIANTNNEYPMHLFFLADIKHCYRFDDDGYHDHTLSGYYDVVYGPKEGVVRSFDNDSKYAGDLNIIKVNASEEIQQGIFIDGHRTHVFGVTDGTSVSIKFPELPKNVNILVNGVDMSDKLQNNILRLVDIQSHSTIELYTPNYISVEADMDNATIYIDGHEQTKLISDNTAHKVHIVPNDGFYISSVSINGVDNTKDLSNRFITIPASAETQTIFVEINAVNEAMLTIKSPDFKVAHYFNNGEKVMVNLTPPEGWDINTVTFNGEDVTESVNPDKRYQTPALSGNDVISVTYKQSEITEVDDVFDTKIRAYTRANSIIIKGKDDSADVILYDTTGNILYRTNESEIEGLSDGVYILKIGDDSMFKLSI